MLRFQQLYGEVPDAWILRADYRLDGPFFAVALPRALHAAVMLAGAPNKLHYFSMLPHTVAAWNRWHSDLARGDWFGVAHQNRLTLIAIVGGVVRATFRADITQDDMKSPEWLSERIRRESLRLMLPLPIRLRLCGEVPKPWTQTAPGRITCVALLEQKAAARSSDAALAFAGVPQ